MSEFLFICFFPSCYNFYQHRAVKQNREAAIGWLGNREKYKMIKITHKLGASNEVKLSINITWVTKKLSNC